MAGVKAALFRLQQRTDCRRTGGSLLTGKTHIRNLYQKLDVAHRQDAVQHARLRSSCTDDGVRGFALMCPDGASLIQALQGIILRAPPVTHCWF